MPYYFNKNHANHETLNSGPYVFRNGLIKTDEANDSTVGPILKTFYGCEQISDIKALAVLEKYKSSALETEGALIKQKIEADKASKEAAEAAKLAAEEAQKAADELKAAEEAAIAEAKAKADAEAKAKAEAEAKAKADAAAKAKPEDKM